MTDELFPCAHCGGNWAFGWSQRVIGGRIRPSTDFLQINSSTAPVMNDMEARSLSEPPTEKLCCILLRRLRDADAVDTRRRRQARRTR